MLQRDCARSSLSNYPDHRRSPTETSGDNTPGSPDFPRCRLTHYPSTSSISPRGCSTSWRRRGDPLRDEAQQTRQTREPTTPKNDTRSAGGSSVVTTSFSRKVQVAYMRQQRRDTRWIGSRGHLTGGQTRVGICRRPRGVIVGSRVENMLAYPKSSSSFTDKLFKETGAMQTEQNLG